ncbi:MAG TPA: flagellar hook-length control protein FliK [Methylomirabilota bacterium]|nr:flagellar hook-length control protein FliK [Methylomirabilota bacterium]
MQPSEAGLPVWFDPKLLSLALSLKSDQRLGRILAGLALGDEIGGTVVEAADDGTLLLSLRGETVQAKSALSLRPGATLTLRLVSTSPEVTLQLVSNEPPELPLTSLASPALSSPGRFVPLMAKLDALISALKPLFSGEPAVSESITPEGEVLSTNTTSKYAGNSGVASMPAANAEGGGQASPATTASLSEAVPQQPIQPGAASAPSLKKAASGSLVGSSSMGESTAQDPSAPQRVSARMAGSLEESSDAGDQTGAKARLSTGENQLTPRLLPDADPLSGRVAQLLAAKPEMAELIDGLSKALAESTVDPRSVTPEAIRKAIHSVADPVERKLLQLLDPQSARAGSAIGTDLKVALTRLLQSSVADSLSEELRQVAAQTLGQVEARQGLNVLAMAHGQLLFEVALHGQEGWDAVEILVEEDGGGGEDGSESPATQVTLQLRPDALGPLRVLARISGDEVSCYLASSESAVAEFVTARLDELRSGLEQHGLQVKALQAVVVPDTPEAFGPLKPSRLLARPLLDARV